MFVAADDLGILAFKSNRTTLMVVQKWMDYRPLRLSREQGRKLRRRSQESLASDDALNLSLFGQAQIKHTRQPQGGPSTGICSNILENNHRNRFREE
ncbi:unnamed protein product [Nippostrongylus brasiliensis]|uniref:Uncharacterized protein n=1 Tax=Nippostrongylus brasiliensis TaxID=27835 RepID=A0A0N4Y0P9_NIPBR|nr:unnamed protein product [Nippostrongylus brasiliensis]